MLHDLDLVPVVASLPGALHQLQSLLLQAVQVLVLLLQFLLQELDVIVLLLPECKFISVFLSGIWNQKGKFLAILKDSLLFFSPHSMLKIISPLKEVEGD